MKEHEVLQDNLETGQGINFFPHLPIVILLNHVISATDFFYLQDINMQNLSHNRHTLPIKGD